MCLAINFQLKNLTSQVGKRSGCQLPRGDYPMGLAAMSAGPRLAVSRVRGLCFTHCRVPSLRVVLNHFCSSSTLSRPSPLHAWQKVSKHFQAQRAASERHTFPQLCSSLLPAACLGCLLSLFSKCVKLWRYRKYCVLFFLNYEITWQVHSL